MNTLTYKQLAFILDITDKDALEKIIAVDCKVSGRSTPGPRDTVTSYLSIGCPRELSVELLMKHLNLPSLPDAIKDIQENFLKRPASRKWILCDYPEKKLETLEKRKVKIPSALASILPNESIAIIRKEWEKRFDIPA